MAFFSYERFFRVMRLAVPAAVGAFVDMLQVLIDLIMVGRLEVAATAAVGISLQFIALIQIVIGILYIGSNALMSRYLGANDYQKAFRVFNSFVLFGVLFSLPLSVVVSLLSDLPFVLMGADERVTALGGQYFFIFCVAFPAIAFNQIVFSAFSAHTDIKTPFKIKLLMAFINVVISYGLIFGTPFSPSFGVAGAAAGTVVVTYLEMLIYVWLIVNRSNPFAFSFAIDMDLIRLGLDVGVPAGIERIVGYVSFLIFTAVIAGFGTTVMAGYQIGLRIEGLAFMSGVGFTIAAMTLTGRHLGAKNYDEAQKDALFTAMSAGSLMAFAGVLMIVFASDIVAIFSDDLDVVNEGALYLKLVGLSQFPLGVTFVLNGVFRGAGDSKTTLRINVKSIWIFRIVPALFVASYFDAIIFVWIVVLIETYIRAIWLFVVFKKGGWKSVEV